jgi:hypothetical protein
MYRSHKLRPLAFGCLVMGAAAVWFVGPTGPASPGEGAPPVRPIYHTDPGHLWNRLHEALFVRTAPDRRAYGHDRLEPLLWLGTKHMLEPRSCDRAARLLDEFLEKKGEKLIDDPLKRAVLQRDLWLVFNWVDGNHGQFADPLLAEEAWRASQKRLRLRLAAVIGRLALSPEQIRRLPDNYAAAVASGQFAKRYDPGRPDQPYLPPDLFAADGPWVCLGRPDGPVAPEHAREDVINRFTNSAFLVFLRLPGGRAATVAYLKRLRAFDQPLMVRDGPKGPGNTFGPSPKLPQFPAGTEVALVRRALLVAAPAELTASPLTESVQLRYYREAPGLTKQTLEYALGGGTPGSRRAQAWQAYHEFRLGRAPLFAGRAGGLRAASDERDFKTGFGAHPWDEFEAVFTGQSFTDRVTQFPVTESCFACHSLPGAYSFNSYFHFRIARGKDDPRPASLAETAPAAVLEAAVKWKRGRRDWASLRDLLAK